MIGLRLLVEIRALGVVTRCCSAYVHCLLLFPSSNSSFTANAYSCSCPFEMIDSLCGVDIPYHTSESYRTYAIWCTSKGINLFPLGVRLCELQLEIVAMSPIGIEENLFLISRRLIDIVLRDSFQLKLPTILL